MADIIGVKELRTHLEKYISQVEKGGSFTVVRRSKPVFKITPLSQEESLWETVIDFTQIKKGGVPMSEVLSRL
ncbi:type II toxin-antitoxin system prevent-host-death family antitoxin [Candidatus Roizmanbacteria bacterium]|nr:type II toxin-antitoxin system prevent-host-death family antitoxin [Candidatus Roizmanbacteria bacterium]